MTINHYLIYYDNIATAFCWFRWYGHTDQQSMCDHHLTQLWTPSTMVS